MDTILRNQVKSLVGENQLEEALQVLISAEQRDGPAKNNALFLLKGKLALLEEQQVGGMLDVDELLREQAKIANAILDICDNKVSSPENRAAAAVPSPQPSPSGTGTRFKYMALGALLLATVLALVFFVVNVGGEKGGSNGGEKPAPAEKISEGGEKSAQKETEGASSSASDDKVLELPDFPNFRKKFNFLDFQFDFKEVKAEWYSDTEIKLFIQYHLTCGSNLGACYRAVPRVYADGQPIGPTHEKDLLGRYEPNSTITNELTFVLPAKASTYHIEFSRDGSSWKRAFKVLQK